MMAKLVILIFCSFTYFINIGFSLDFLNPDLIYGPDDRYEIDDYQDPKISNKGRSVAIRILNKKLSADRNDQGLINFPYIKLKQRLPNLCPSEKYLDQYSLGDCSGFLVDKNKLATAGHCMFNQSECKSYSWVFDYKLGTKNFLKNNVYHCKKIIVQKYVYNQKEVNDYAVIELDREVLDRQPLRRRKFGRINLGTKLVVIGHPLGLPLKISDNARVSRMNEEERNHKFHSLILRRNYFTANLDTYAGNSGSPVINQVTGKVEGILIQGAEDFNYNYELGCLESQKLSDSYLNTYEKIMRIKKVPLL